MKEINENEVPKNLIEFEKMFSSEEQCVNYIIKLKHKDKGFKCDICGNEKYWKIGTYKMKCTSCNKRVSILKGTIFEGIKKPLTLYFRAIWYIVSQKNGTNASTIKSLLGLGSYNSAWAWLHKIRRAMLTMDRTKLKGNVEVDETQFGKTTNDRRGRGTNQLKLIVAVELNYNKLGRIRIKKINDFSVDSLHPFILNNVEIGSNIITDDWNGYNGIEEKGYTREKNISSEETMIHVHLVISLLKRWILGTLQGSYSSKYFDYYLDEFVFRFNRRNSKDRGLLFYRLFETAVIKSSITVEEIKKRANSDQESSSENNIPK